MQRLLLNLHIVLFLAVAVSYHERVAHAFHIAQPRRILVLSSARATNADLLMRLKPRAALAANQPQLSQFKIVQSAPFDDSQLVEPLPFDSSLIVKRLRGEPIRFGKRSPREPIRFGKRDMATSNHNNWSNNMFNADDYQ